MTGYRIVFLAQNASDPGGGYDLWVTDGTAAGTTQIYAAAANALGVDPNENPSGAFLTGNGPPYAVIGQDLVFVGVASGGDEQLFSSDGTAAGTTALSVPTAPAAWKNIQSLTGFDDGKKAVFAAPDSGGFSRLWVTDGTGTGTTEVPVSGTPSGLNPSQFAALGTLALFDADTGSGVTEWVTDGTGPGTFALTVPGASAGATDQGFFSFSVAANGSPLGNFAVFEADGAAGAKNLYVTNGTSAGTSLVTLSLTGTADIRPEDFIALNGVVLFDGNGTTADQPVAITMNGTLATASALSVTGLKSVASFAAADGAAVVLADHVFFTGITTAGDAALWETDGTAADTTEVAGFAATADAPKGMNPSEPTVVGTDVAFVGVDAAGDNQVFLYDGSTTTAITIPGGGWSLPAFAGQVPGDLQGLGNTLLFTAVNSSGVLEHWSYNVVTATGSGIALADQAVVPGYPLARMLAGVPSTPLALIYLPDDHSPDAGLSYDLAVWITDGTTAGTSELFSPGYGFNMIPVAQATDSDGNDAFVRVGTHIVFGTESSSSVYQLFSTDGTSAGTVALPAGGSQISGMVTIGSRAVFADYGNTASTAGLHELWATDGTPGGTSMLTVANQNTNYHGLDPHQITAFGNSWLFYGADTVTYHPWITDGTAAGTTELSTTATDVSSITPIGGGKAVFSADTGTGPPESLWVTDGTPGGTSAVPGVSVETASGSFSSDFVAWGTKAAFFGEQFGGPSGIWVTDGTEAGTTKITSPYILGNPVGVVGGRLLTEVPAPTNELYSTDGTSADTSILAQVGLGSGFTPLGDSGRDVFEGVGASGNAGLWVTDGTPSGTKEVAVNGADAGGVGPIDLTPFGSEVLFNGANAAGYSGLWITDGTTAGTHPISIVGANTGVDQGPIDITELVACFAEGTRILTGRGEVAVDALRVGATVPTLSGATRTVRWIGHRRIDCRRHPRPAEVWPVRVSAHAFGVRRPRRDLLLSPDHAVLTSGVLIPIRYLVNGASVAQEKVDTVTYWHVELDRHDVLLAEGLAAESYLDTGNRSAFANGGAAARLGWCVEKSPDYASVSSGLPG